MKFQTFKEFVEMRNHMGETEVQTWSSWIRLLRKLYPGFTIEGDRDIAQAFWNKRGVGEWDGGKGTIYRQSELPQPNPTYAWSGHPDHPAGGID